VIRRAWAPRGHTPVIGHRFKWKRASMAAALCYGSRGGGASLAFHHQVGAYNPQTLIGALDQLRRFLGGQKATLLWDGLPAHRSLAMAAWLRRQRSWLVVERLPAYAPELNPVAALWSSLKGRKTSRTRYSSPRQRRNAQALARCAIDCSTSARSPACRRL
jgi:transposase